MNYVLPPKLACVIKVPKNEANQEEPTGNVNVTTPISYTLLVGFSQIKGGLTKIGLLEQ